MSAHINAYRYAARIRNASKSQYAERYIDHLVQGAPAPEVPTDLSYMAAQAVRLAVHEILAGGSNA